jgi:hypothetical protein
MPVQVVHHVLVKHVSFIDEKDWVHSFAAEIFDVRRDCIEDGGGSRRRRKADGGAELPIEVAAAERGIVAVRQAKPLGRNALAQCPEYACLSDAGIAREYDRFSRFARGEEPVDDVRL